MKEERYSFSKNEWQIREEADQWFVFRNMTQTSNDAEDTEAFVSSLYRTDGNEYAAGRKQALKLVEEERTAAIALRYQNAWKKRTR